LKDDTQAYEQFVENESLQLFVGDTVFAITSLRPADGEWLGGSGAA
jgi:hypothetical protein